MQTGKKIPSSKQEFGQKGYTKAKAIFAIVALIQMAPFVAPSEARAADIERHTLNVAGHEWTYHVHRPGKAAAGPLPLVLVFHGAGGGGKAYLERNGWVALSERAGFIVAAPDGLPILLQRPADFRSNPRVWNSRVLKPDRPRSRIDDVAFVAAMIDAIASRDKIDPQRIHATGHSNGASMVYGLAARIPERIGAIAPVMGQNASIGERPSRAVPTLAILGGADPLLPVDGGIRQLPWGVGEVPSQAAGISAWAQSLGCTGQPRFERDDDRVRIERYTGCRGDVPFVVWHLKRHGHGWPGGAASGLPGAMLGPDSGDLDATELIWQFFTASRNATTPVR